MSVRPVPMPRVWHLPRTERDQDEEPRRVVVGRQGIFRSDGSLLGYELLFRAPGRLNLRIDLWNSWQQDRATEHVLAAAYFHGDDIASGLPTFVNFTRSYLLDPTRYLHPPSDFVIEVVESAHADRSLHDRLAELKAKGYKVAIDDFVGTTSQRDLLEHADYVKIDMRDLTARGTKLIDAARVPHASLVAERVENKDALHHCMDAGFHYFQGHHFEKAAVVERSPVRVR